MYDIWIICIIFVLNLIKLNHFHPEIHISEIQIAEIQIAEIQIVHRSHDSPKNIAGSYNMKHRLHCEKQISANR